jgi:hypothetical protein
MSTLPEKRIHENAKKAWRVSSGLFGLLLFTLPAFLFFLYLETDLPVKIPIIVAPICVLLYAFLVGYFPIIRWNRWRYNVNEEAVDMQRGIIIVKRTAVPINRIQHVDTKKGPIYKKYGLSSVSISTAATTHEIPALDDDTATEMRNLISELVRKVKEDV